MDGRKVCSFKDRITELVNSSSKSRTALAADLHVAKQTLSAWITGQNSPRDPVIVALAEYFGVSVAWLMGYDVPRLSDSGLSVGWEELHSAVLHENDFCDDERRLLIAYRGAEPAIKKAALRMLEDSATEQKSKNQDTASDQTA